MVESLWAIPDITQLRTPISILREQATALTEQTSGVLVGAVSVDGGDGRRVPVMATRVVDNETIPDGIEVVRRELEVRLSVVVPALNSYVSRILVYDQPIAIYPGMLSGIGISDPKVVADELEFVNGVREALSSKPVRDLLRSLLSQAKEL